MAFDPFGPGDYGTGPFDDLFARFFSGSLPQGPVRRIDIGQLLTEQARDLVRDAAGAAGQWGDADLDTDHLLWAATQQEPLRRLLVAAGANPDAIARTVESHSAHGQPRDDVPDLTPAAKRALLDARQVSRALGSSYIGPDHLLFALALNPESAAGRVLRDVRVTPESLRNAAAGGAGRAGHPSGAGGADGAGRPPSETPAV